MVLSGVSTNGTSEYTVRVGSGSFATSGYASNVSVASPAVATAALTGAFIVTQSIAATDLASGHIVLSNITGDTWVCSGLLNRSGAGGVMMSAGTVSLGGALDRIQLTTNSGTSTFDAGTVNVMWEG